MNKWSHLPNAVHIDRVLASVNAHLTDWAAARLAVTTAAGSAAWDAAWKAARDAPGDAARYAAWKAAREVAWYAAWKGAGGAIVALIAWDHSAKYLDMPSDQLQVWHALSEDPACLLLLPAVTAFEKIKELELV